MEYKFESNPDFKKTDPAKLNDEDLIRLVCGCSQEKALEYKEQIFTCVTNKKLQVALELGRRFSVKPTHLYLGTSDRVFHLLHHYALSPQEQVIVIGCSASLELIYEKVVTIGLVNKALIHPREIFADAILNNATGIIIAHNHPSRDLTPSTEDFDVTNTICKAGKLLGIPVIDHIIFCYDSYRSMKESGDFCF